jgi:hypothetical protein
MTTRPSILALTLLAALPASTARASDARVCDGAYDQAQTLRDAKKLVASRDQLRVCASAACPAFMVKDCTAWLGEIEPRIPSVVLIARDAAGGVLPNVAVSMDAGARSFKLDGTSSEVDPGRHTFTFVAPDGRSVEKLFLVVEGAKDQRVAVTFAEPGPTPAPPAASPVISAVPPEPAATSRPSPLLPIILGGLGVASVGASIGIGVAAQSDANNLQRTCAPGCSTQSVSDVRTQLIASDVLFGLGVAAVATAAVVFFARRTGHASAPTAGLVVAPSGSFGLAF